jgi:LacI family transcriptional regulator
MKDVADRAGVSTATVSVVLSGKASGIRIPEETQRRVAEIAAELGYQPNALAAGLRRQTSDTIGLVSDVIATTPHAGALVQGIQDALREAGKVLIMVNTDGEESAEQAAVDVMLGRQVDGIVFASMYHRIIEPPTAARRVPLILLDARSTDPELTSVAPDEEGGAIGAVTHLIEAGHRRIAYLQDEIPKPATVERFSGYRTALANAGIDIDTGLVMEETPEHTGGYEAANRLLDQTDRPTAIFCFNDRMAAGVARAARHRGLEVPRDLSIVGFDNQELVAPLVEPPLTTVQLPHYEMGHWAGKRILAMIDRPESTIPEQRRMPCTLVSRSSVGPPPATS